jgi:predicted dehydrogenase
MCEKPMTLLPEHAWELAGLAQRQQLHLLVPYGWHYKPFVREAKQLMMEGEVGKIEYVLGHMASPTRAFFAGRGTVPVAFTPTFGGPEGSTWQEKEHGGGYGYGQITHLAALMFWLTGLRGRSVVCRMTQPNSKVDMYDSASIEFEGDAVGVISGAATLPDGCPFQVDIRIFGDRGVLLLDAESGRERLQLYRSDGSQYRAEVPTGQGDYSCAAPVEAFIDLIQAHGTNESPAEVAARAVELIDAMYRSARQGAVRVAIDPMPCV